MLIVIVAIIKAFVPSILLSVGLINLFLFIFGLEYSVVLLVISILLIVLWNMPRSGLKKIINKIDV